MFKKLKEKITEEVKSSPQRFADFTQSVSDKLQNNSSSEDNFFSIGDDDSSTPTNSAEQGFASVALVSPTQETRGRRDSNSSLASDVSFLPRYESGSMYHLQSDLDISTSELEDNASTASSQIGHLTKEQIYSAFQKSQMRYHKYRGRYTDLARHYKELERENAKMKSVLVETQDKAIRRVTELKEQCSLEQRAKAHLEAALRDELDEKNFKVHTLQTKIQLLQGGEYSDLLVNIDGKENQTENLDNLTKYLNDARKEIEALNEKIQEMKANVIVFQSKEQEYKTKIGNLERDIAQYSEREKENNLKLAENKMDLHNELLNKDAEISDLKKDNETLRQKLEVVEAENKISGGTKLENLQSQNTKLIDKVESLTLKCNNLESELLKVEQYKIEIKELREKEAILLKELFDFKNENCDLKDSLSKERKDFENQITAIREDAKKGLLSLEPKIREKLQNEHLQKEEELKREFAKRIEEVSSQKDAQLLLFERDDQIKTLNEELDVVKQELSKKIDEYSDLERNHLELIEDCSQLRNTIESLEKEKSSLESSQEKIVRLESHITTLQEELKEIEEIARHKEKENVYLSQENLNLQQELTETSQKLRIFEEKYEAIQLESSESKMLELKLQKLEGEKQELLEEFESERKIFNGMLEDNKELREKEQLIIELRQDLDNIRHEMGHLNENLRLEREKNVMLYDKKHHLELEVDTLQEKVRIFEEKTEAQEMDSPECGLLKLQVQNLEKENKMLQESFEHERLTFADELDNIKRDMSTNELRDIVKVWEDQTLRHTPVDELRIKLHDIRRLAESKEKENVYLAEENLKLQQENRKVSESLRLLEEKLESIQLESGESKLLELKVQQLEEENSRHAREFEMERKMYNNLLENDKELKIKEELIARLNENLKTSHQEVIKLEEILQAEKEENVLLGKQKLSLEQQVEKLTEQVRIAEEKDEAIVMDVNECNLLEMKLSKLEEENKSLEESFELERKCFNKSYEEHARNEAKLKTLLEENYKIKELVKKEKENVEKLSKYLKDKENEQKRTEDQYMQSLKKIDEMEKKIKTLKEFEKENESSLKKLETLNRENEELRKEVAGKEGQVAELSKNIANLSEVIQKQTKEFNSLLERTQQLETVLARIQTDSAEAIKKEKERQNELTLKIKELQRDLDEKTEKLAGLSEQLAKVEKQYTEEKHNYESKSREIDSLHKKIAELQAVEESYKMIGEEKRVIDTELVRLKTVENSFKAIQSEKIDLENKLKQVESEFKSKNNEVVQKFKVAEQSCVLLKGEKQNLLGEIEDLRNRLEEMNAENANLRNISARVSESDYTLEQLKNQNEVLQNETERYSKEISELNLRISQISADNRTIEEENHSLTQGNEELKIKMEFLEREKENFDGERSKLLEEKQDLHKNVEEIERELNDVKQKNLELVNDKVTANSNEVDISKIQQDFYEIKEKCDSLFVENRNLKSEYAKLEGKCNDFSKIRKQLETQIAEMENQYTEMIHERQLLKDEIQELKISPVNIQGDSSKLDHLEIIKQEKSFTTDASRIDKDKFLKEIELLQDKLTQYKSLDITNKSSIEFYENELQKIKSQNEKLNRKLDETLVTLSHCAELSTSTEVEYLKNVLYNYMLGKESLVLARVIAAVCKFDPEQTDAVLQREQQKQTLLGQLGII